MNEYLQYSLVYGVCLLLFFLVKPYALRKWLGISLAILGMGAIFVLPPFIDGFDTGVITVNAVGLGAALFFSRYRYQEERG